jgi:hypothetical protein
METNDSGSINSEKISNWTVTVIEDGDELILPLPEDMLAAVGWKTGDVLEWIEKDNESWMLKKKEQSDKEDS